ncbi:MAG: DUF1648 domain-containing protein [Bacteroidota bacterium]
MRPKITVKLQSTDKVLELLGYLAFIVLWAFTILAYSNSSGQVPSHFNAAGKIDAISGRDSLWTLAIVGSSLFIGLSVILRFPNIYNYPVVISEENAARQYSLATRLIRWIRLVTVTAFAVLAIDSYLLAIHKIDTISKWFLVALVVSILAVMIDYFIRSFKK